MKQDDSNWSLLLLEAEHIYSDIYSRVLSSTRPYQALNDTSTMKQENWARMLSLKLCSLEYIVDL